MTLSSPRTGTATVFIGLINANDNSPVFALDQYILAAVEEMAPGTLSTTTPSLSISMIQVPGRWGEERRGGGGEGRGKGREEGVRWECLAVLCTCRPRMGIQHRMYLVSCATLSLGSGFQMRKQW